VSAGSGRRHVRAVAKVVVVAIAIWGTARERDAHAEEQEPEAFARVIVDAADLRTGPGISYRTLFSAHRGETFAVDSRAGKGFWLKVTTQDGRAAFILGDEVQTFAVREGDADDASSQPSRPGFLAPPPLEGAHGGFAILGGMMVTKFADGTRQGSGYLEARPSIVVHRTVALEAFVGDALTADGSQVLYGASMQIHLAPSWPVCPYVGLGVGGLSIFPNADSFVLRREDLYVGRAGGGILFALKGRILVRLDVTNMTLFGADVYRNGQTYSGGLGVYF
jgi:hypothetical protein